MDDPLKDLDIYILVLVSPAWRFVFILVETLPFGDLSFILIFINAVFIFLPLTFL